MNKTLIQERWIEISNRIHSKWAKMSHRDITGLNENLDALEGKIRALYGFSREHAARDCHDFIVSLRSLLHPVRPAR